MWCTVAARDDQVGAATIPFRQQNRSGFAADQDAHTAMASVHPDRDRGHPEETEIGGDGLDGRDRSDLGHPRSGLFGQLRGPLPGVA